MSYDTWKTTEPPHECRDCCGKCQSCPCECCSSCGAAPDVACDPMCPEQLDRTNTRLLFQLDGQRQRIAELEAENARLKAEYELPRSTTTSVIVNDSKTLHLITTLMEENVALQQRLAEAESRLREARDLIARLRGE